LLLLIGSLGLVSVLPGCGSSGPAPVGETEESPDSVDQEFKNEMPVPTGLWRGHRLSDCVEDVEVPQAVENDLAECSELFRDGSGSDGMIELEMALEAGRRHSLTLLTLGQLYMMAGQGEPTLRPVEGPAADVGDWDRNRVRLLGRAESLLAEAAALRPDDGAVVYLQADVARAQGNLEMAAELVARAMTLCTGGRSFNILRFYQVLNRYPARYLGGPAPEYPQAALRERLTGEVVLDVLLDPAGAVRRTVAVKSPGESLSRAATASFGQGSYEAARIGKYPVWAWLRVTTAFNLQ